MKWIYIPIVMSTEGEHGALKRTKLRHEQPWNV